jgi:glycosyltransferase involved in cell wall biosynthesis
MPMTDGSIEPLLFGERVVTLTEASALRLRSAGVSDVEVIRPCVPMPENPLSLKSARRRLRFSLPELRLHDAPAFLYAGDIETSDGALTFIEAAARVIEVLPEARFILACREKRVDKDHPRLRVQARVLALGISEQITLLGHVSDMPALQTAVTAMVLAVDTLHAKVETPIVLLESMAQGVPVVVSDLPALMELSGLGQGVSVVPRSAPDALAARLIELASSPSLQARMARGARKTIADHFCPTKSARAYEALYREVSGA